MLGSRSKNWPQTAQSCPAPLFAVQGTSSRMVITARPMQNSSCEHPKVSISRRRNANFTKMQKCVPSTPRKHKMRKLTFRVDETTVFTTCVKQKHCFERRKLAFRVGETQISDFGQFRTLAKRGPKNQRNSSKSRCFASTRRNFVKIEQKKEKRKNVEHERFA